MSLRTPAPVDVHGLFHPDRDALVALLRDLPAEAWRLATVCSGWDVHDVALHIVGGDLSGLARHRDGYALEQRAGESKGAFIGRINEEWVTAARRLSPRLAIELLETSGPPFFEHLEGLEPTALGGPVSWAGPGPAPVWLDVAREYMERWVHQQHIRDAVDRPGQREARFVAPVIAASMHALPVALAAHAAGGGCAVTVAVEGDAGGTWTVVKEARDWRLYEGAPDGPRTTVVVPADDWWRIVTLGLRVEDAWHRATTAGDADLGRAVLSAVAIISSAA